MSSCVAPSSGQTVQQSEIQLVSGSNGGHTIDQNRPKSGKAPRRVNTNRSRRKSKEEWEAIKEPFTRLYVDEELPLKEVIERLQDEHNFEASENQWKFIIKKWKVDKKAKGNEMKHIIKIQLGRQLENPPKQTVFSIRHQRVDEAKIERYKRRHDTFSIPSSETPSAITWRSPSPDLPLLQRNEWTPWNSWNSTYVNSNQHNGGHLDYYNFGYRAPALQDFDWWSPYGHWSLRQHIPKPRHIPLFDTFHPLLLESNTYESERLNQLRQHECNIVETELIRSGFSPPSAFFGYLPQCPLLCGNIIADRFLRGSLQSNIQQVQFCGCCKLVSFVQLHMLWEAALAYGAVALSYPPDRRWILSESLKLTLQYGGSFPWMILVTLVQVSTPLPPSSIPAICKALVDQFRPKALELGCEVYSTCALSTLACSIRDFSTAPELLKWIMRSQPGLSDDMQPDDRTTYAELPNRNAKQPRHLLARRFHLASYNIYQWFLRHPIAKQRIFDQPGNFIGFTFCSGVYIGKHHFCFSGQCSFGPEIPFTVFLCDEDLNANELKYVDRDFTLPRDFWKICAQSLWLFLQRYGHIFDDPDMPKGGTDLVPQGPQRSLRNIKELQGNAKSFQDVFQEQSEWSSIREIARNGRIIEPVGK